MVYVYYALSKGMDLPLIGSVRGGIIALAVVGIFLCAFGFSNIPDWSNPWIIAASLLGVLAIIAIVLGLITASQSVMLFLTVTLVALWFVTTLRHALTPS
jgi:hypothetical protein